MVKSGKESTNCHSPILSGKEDTFFTLISGKELTTFTLISAKLFTTFTLPHSLIPLQQPSLVTAPAKLVAGIIDNNRVNISNDLEESFTAPTSFFYILIILLLYHVDWPFSVYLSGSVEKIFAVKSNDKNVTYLSLFS